MPPKPHPRDLMPHPKIPSQPALMAEHKNSHKGGRVGARVGTETDDSLIEKNKTRRKYQSSIPLQEYQTLARSTNLDNPRPGNGNNPRPGSRAQSEMSDLSGENDVSPTNSHTHPDNALFSDNNTTALNVCKRRAMEEEEGLIMTPMTMSRPATPSPSGSSLGSEVNKTPKAKLRDCPDNWPQSHVTIDKDYSDMGGYQDLQMSSKEEQTGNCIIKKMEDVLEELTAAKQTPIWDKLDFIDQWVDCMASLIGSPKGNDKDRQVITNLAETNAYLTRKIVNLKLNSPDFTPETIQSHQVQEQAPIKRTTQPTPQKSWAQVANSAHKNVPIQPAKQVPAKQRPTNQEKTADPRCLIIQVSPPILATERPNGIDARN